MCPQRAFRLWQVRKFSNAIGLNQPTSGFAGKGVVNDADQKRARIQQVVTTAHAAAAAQSQNLLIREVVPVVGKGVGAADLRQQQRSQEAFVRMRVSEVVPIVPDQSHSAAIEQDRQQDQGGKQPPHGARSRYCVARSVARIVDHSGCTRLVCDLSSCWRPGRLAARPRPRLEHDK